VNEVPSPARSKGLLLPGVVVLVGFFILLSLGLWQVERLAWKEGLIITLDRRVNVAPAPLPLPGEWPKLSQAADEFRRVTATLQFVDRAPAYAYTAGSLLRPDVKAPGYFVFAPARLASGEVVVVNAGYVPDRKHPNFAGMAKITGYLRWPEAPRWFVAASNPEGSVWHVRDHRAMAERLAWGENIAPFYIDQESPVPPGGLPRPGPLTVKLRNDHLGYAITWFGLAAGLLAVFGFWAVGRDRASRRFG
jgi:surfeit locus 1 family protein